MGKMWQSCSTIEKALVMLSGVVFTSAMCFLVYFETIFNKKTIHEDDKIAEVVSTDQQVRRRMPMSFEFDELGEGDLIGNGDAIFSGDNSQIMMKFLKGSQLVIGEQSLVVLREIDGKMDMKIEKGGISASLAESDEIEIQADEESVTINGEKDAQFSVSYKPGLGMEIISFEKNINVKYRGDEVQLKDKKAFVSNKKGIETAKRSNNPSAGRESRDPATKQTDDDSDNVKAALPNGVTVDDIKKSMSLTLSAPFPPNNQAFLHNKGGQIPIFPKSQCIYSCKLSLKINGKPALNKKFSKGTVPIVHIKIDKNIEAHVTWTFKDGAEKQSGEFKVLKNNEKNFTKALQQQMQIEVLN